jgi:hypothetical protein
MSKSLKQIAEEDRALSERLHHERDLEIMRQFTDKLESVGKQGDIRTYLRLLLKASYILESRYPDRKRLNPLRDLVREGMIFARRLLRRELIRRALTKPTPEIVEALMDDADKSIDDELDWVIVNLALENKTSPFAGVVDKTKAKMRQIMQ